MESPERRSAGDVRAEIIARRLSALASLSADEINMLRQVSGSPATLWAPRSLIEQPVDQHPSPRYVVGGWAARVRDLEDGRRQIIQILLPGDPLAPHVHVRDRLHSVQCITMVQTVDATPIRLSARDRIRSPGIAAVVELAAAHDRALLLEQVTRLGRQTAYERVASLFMELHYRFTIIGMVTVNSFPLPLTQESLGDVLGLSVVHVNRTLQLMRNQGLISLRHGRLGLLDIPALQQAGEFRAPVLEYLN